MSYVMANQRAPEGRLYWNDLSDVWAGIERATVYEKPFFPNGDPIPSCFEGHVWLTVDEAMGRRGEPDGYIHSYHNGYGCTVHGKFISKCLLTGMMKAKNTAYRVRVYLKPRALSQPQS
jgi:hypothetical protein